MSPVIVLFISRTIASIVERSHIEFSLSSSAAREWNVVILEGTVATRGGGGRVNGTEFGCGLGLLRGEVAACKSNQIK